MFTVDDVPLNLDAAELKLIKAALRVTTSRREAAELLGISRQGLYRRLVKYDLIDTPESTPTLSLVSDPEDAA